MAPLIVISATANTATIGKTIIIGPRPFSFAFSGGGANGENEADGVSEGGGGSMGSLDISRFYASPILLKLHPRIYWLLVSMPVDAEKPTCIVSKRI